MDQMSTAPDQLNANTTIYYDRDGYDTQGQKLMGRQAAGEGFLRGWMQYGGANPISLWTQSLAQGDLGARQLLDMGWLGQTQRCGGDNLEGLLQTGNLFLPGPGLGEAAWLRHWHGDQKWSLCGITHTTASHRAMDSICGALHAPTQPWDALICTSKAVLSTVENLFEREADWLKHRFGATHMPRPQLPMISLGVHVDDFTRDEALRHQWRNKLNIDTDTICVLWMGRLSFHAKAIPDRFIAHLKSPRKKVGKRSVCCWQDGLPMTRNNRF
ncbi:MAG: glycosyltransferase family 4 protein [Hyphomonadaceae bacterium]|nr:glycosyltransferase family 4 protein [Hyphomonadaceae bacterium]